MQSRAKDAALKCLASQDTGSKEKVEQLFEKLENPFTSLNQNEMYFLRKNGKLFNLLEKVLGVRFENRRNQSTGTYDQVVCHF